MTKTLLLADDSVVIQKLVGLSFANESVKLITTDNGEDAITRAREAHPDLVLADVVMPGRNGYEVCEAIKQDPALADIPVLLLTGTFEAFDEERAKAVGSNGHITKPFEAQVLVDRVNALLAQARPAPAKASATAAAPVEAISADSYEFFDEEPAALTPPAAATSNKSHALTDLGSPDDEAFSFGTDDTSFDSLDPISSPKARAASEAGGDRTVAMMPPAMNSSSRPGRTVDFDDLGATVLADEPRTQGFSAKSNPAATQLVDDPFGDEPPDFSFDGEPSDADVLDLQDADGPSAPLSREDTLLADDLFGDSVSGHSKPSRIDSNAITPATPVDDFDLDDDPAPLIDSNSDLGVSALDEEELAGADFEGLEPIPASNGDAALDAEDSIEPALMESEPLSDAESFHAEDARDDLADSQTGPFADHAEDDRSPEPAMQPALSGATTRPDLSPMLRDRLHESLEKIAWEAFADLSETIVKQVLERVEAVAWEVIPQMAEALIQEEIRRMKGDGED